MIDHVHIGGLTYTVEEAGGMHDNQAEVYYEQCHIRVSRDVDEQIKPCEVLHEAIHAMLYMAGYAKHKERIVLTLGYQLIAFMRDNPHFVNWVMAENPPLEDAALEDAEPRVSANGQHAPA
jgi:hypothetical protein